MCDAERISTRVAHAGWNEHRFFGFSVFDEIAGVESSAGLAALSVTGRRLSAEKSRVLDDIAGVLTVADPRIFPLKVTRILSSYGSAIPAFVAGFVYFGESFLGPRAAANAAEMLVGLRRNLKNRRFPGEGRKRALEEALAGYIRIPGFGIPFRSRDERVLALERLIARRRRNELVFWRLQELVVGIVRKQRNLEPNVSLLVAAASLDLGLAPEDIVPLYAVLNANAFVANAVEGARDPQPCLRSLPVSRVEYSGSPPRQTPRASTSES
jgi:hypothetical protein